MPSTFVDGLLGSYKDADLVRYIGDSPRLSSYSSVSLLSANLVSKECQPDLIEDTLKAMEVARQLGIRVPNVKRVVHFDDMVYLIMERVDGVSLETAWNKLGWIKSLRLALELRGYIRSLRSITSSTAGSLNTGECRSFWLDDLYRLPPRSSPADLASFLSFWVNFSNPRAAMKFARDQLPAASSKDYIYLRQQGHSSSPITISHLEIFYLTSPTVFGW